MAAPAPTSTTHTLALPLPHALASKIHIHLTIASHHLLLFLTSRTPESPGGPAPLGSFVYALPSTTQKTPLSTPLYTREDTVETATRVAKILARRTGRPAYVGCSMSFAAAGRGGSVEEEMEGVRAVVEAVVGLVNDEGLREGVEGMAV